MIFLNFLLYFTILNNIETTLECHTLFPSFYLYTASPTPYRHIFNRPAIEVESENIFNQCTPKKIWMFIRHGTRYPGKKFIQQLSNELVQMKNNIIENYQNEKSILCKNDIEKLKSWTNTFNLEEAKYLAHEGEDEMIGIAERFQDKFPTLLPKIYSNTTLRVRFTDTQRTRESTKYFLTGLFGRAISKHVWFPEPKNPDPVLRSYKLCNRWLTEIYKQPKGLFELNRFKASNIIKDLIIRISDRLGFSEDKLNFENILMMYKACSFESSRNKNNPSPWCSIFNEDEFKTLEYAEDLKHFQFHGYAFNITSQSSCPLLCDLIDFLSNQETEPRASLYVSHSGSLLKFLTILGLYRDPEPLTGDFVVENRSWRVGKIAPFAGNLVFVLNECNSTLELALFHNEKLIPFPWNKEKSLRLDLFLNSFNNIYNNCNFDEICRNSDTFFIY